MKGVKSMALANTTSKRLQSDDIIAQRIHLPNNVELVETLDKILLQNKKLTNEMTEVKSKLKEVEDKLNSIEIE